MAAKLNSKFLTFGFDAGPGWGVDVNALPAGDGAGPSGTTVGLGISLGASAGPASSSLTNVLYATEAGDKASISANDIHQGQIGDCFLLAAVGDLAIYSPATISKMVNVNANGTESVKLFESPNGQVPTFGATSYSQVSETVTNSFPTNAVNNGSTQDVVGSSKEIWAQVVEKAYAQADGGYGVIGGGGNPCIALQQLTGHAAQFESASHATAAALTANLANGDLVVMDTANSSSLPFGLVGNHAYMFEGLVNTAGGACVQLGNPWGTNQPALIPVGQLSRGIVEVDIGHTK